MREDQVRVRVIIRRVRYQASHLITKIMHAAIEGYAECL
jgi:hypothetical protein